MGRIIRGGLIAFGASIVVATAFLVSKGRVTIPPINGKVLDILTEQPIADAYVSIFPGTMSPGFLDPSIEHYEQEHYRTDSAGEFHSPRRRCSVSPIAFGRTYSGALIRVEVDTHVNFPIIERDGKHYPSWYSSPIRERDREAPVDVTIYLYPKVSDVLSLVDLLVDCQRNPRSRAECSSIVQGNISKFGLIEGFCSMAGDKGYNTCLMHLFTKRGDETACNQHPMARWEGGKCIEKH